MKYCQYCGKELKEGADICLNCGKILDRKNGTKAKIPGKGKSIASFVLGIISCVIILSSFSDIYYYGLEEMDDLFITLAIGITGLVLGIIGYKQSKHSLGLTGWILSLISLALLFIELMIYSVY